MTEAGHLHVISSGGIALALFLLLRGYRNRSGVLVLAGWVVSAWQISLGFTLGLQYSYLLAVLGRSALCARALVAGGAPAPRPASWWPYSCCRAGDLPWSASSPSTRRARI